MDQLIEAIRNAVVANSTSEARRAGAEACRTLLLALESEPHEPAASAQPAMPTPIALSAPSSPDSSPNVAPPTLPPNVGAPALPSNAATPALPSNVAASTLPPNVAGSPLPPNVAALIAMLGKMDLNQLLEVAIERLRAMNAGNPLPAQPSRPLAFHLVPIPGHTRK